MTPYYTDDAVTLYHGDCLDVLRDLPDASIDAVVTDPPYELGFMGKGWDTTGVAYRVDLWRECLRVLKPGGHLLAFGGTRTWHRLACAIEDAGFEVRDSIAWLHSQGFPKSLDVSKSIDKAAGAEREVVGTAITGAAYTRGDKRNADDGFEGGQVVRDVTAPATDDARRWQGWGTALKPAFEPVVVARKPLAGTVASNVLAHGTGALNVDATRVGTNAGWSYPNGAGGNGFHGGVGRSPDGTRTAPVVAAAGRWPANVILDESQAAELDRQSGVLTSGANPTRRGSDKFRDAYGDFTGQAECEPARGADSGGASRFFYVAKAPTSERPRVKADAPQEAVIERSPRCAKCGYQRVNVGESVCKCAEPEWVKEQRDYTAHPTVKPLDLMRWLVRLVTPPGGVVLDPFVGSGTTAEACVIEGFRCIAIEREADYLPLIVQRLTKPIQPDLFGGTA